MNAPVTIKGWCPTALQPMQSGDGWLVRVRLRDATLRPACAQALAQCARDFGNGQIDLTQRANLQLRGVRRETLGPLVAALRDIGLVGTADDAGQVVNIVTSALAGLDPAMYCDPRPIASAIEDGLLADAAFRALPTKFGFAIDAGGLLPLADVLADIRLSAIGDDEMYLAIDGSDRSVEIGETHAPSAVLRLAHAFLALRSDERRMRTLVGKIGADAIFAHAGLATQRQRNTASNAAHRMHLGVIDLGGRYAVGVAAPFGAWSGDDLRLLAECAAQNAAEIRVTPWRAFLVAPLSSASAACVADAFRQHGLIVSPDDPRLHVAACVGAPACTSATVETRALAMDLARDLPTSADVALHVSGCAKGCAHPQEAPLALIGRGGRFDLVVHGRADAAAVLANLGPTDAMAAIRARCAG